MVARPIVLYCVVCFLLFLESVRGASSIDGETCGDLPPDGFWSVVNYVDFPEESGGELLTSRSMLQLTRTTDAIYSGKAVGLVVAPAAHFQAGEEFSYTVLAVYDRATGIMSVAINMFPSDYRDVAQWSYSNGKFTGTGANEINGTVTPFGLRQEIVFLG